MSESGLRSTWPLSPSWKISTVLKLTFGHLEYYCTSSFAAKLHFNTAETARNSKRKLSSLWIRKSWKTPLPLQMPKNLSLCAWLMNGGTDPVSVSYGPKIISRIWDSGVTCSPKSWLTTRKYLFPTTITQTNSRNKKNFLPPTGQKRKKTKNKLIGVSINHRTKRVPVARVAILSRTSWKWVVNYILLKHLIKLQSLSQKIAMDTKWFPRFFRNKEGNL